MVEQAEDLGFLKQREAGVLLHVTSLPGGHGIGDLGPSAYQFIDWLVQAGLSVWQMLPLVPPGRGFSPYSTWSSLALSTWLIDLDELGHQGLLGSDWVAKSDEAKHKLNGNSSGGSDRVDVHAMEAFKRAALKRAWTVFSSWPSDHALKKSCAAFIEKHAWVRSAALYGVLRERYGKGWTEWPKADAAPSQQRLDALFSEKADAVAEAAFFQFLAHEQLARLRSYAARQGVRLVGDLPIYVDLDSVDVWLNPGLFDLDDKLQARRVSGVPPDAFTELGQLWNHPIYKWSEHERQGFGWWIQRLGRCLEQSDVVRIDHFRGFAAYWSIPGGAPDARHGQWVQGPGLKLFRALEQGLGGRLPVIAEDLGYIDDAVRHLKNESALPGMCVLEFGFGVPESEGDLVHHPDHHPRFAVVYTGTHDNEPVVQWRQSMSMTDKNNLARFFDHEGLSDRDFAWRFVELCLSSRSQLAVVPLQDLLALGAEARMNRPGTEDGNWVWRALPEQISAALAAQVRGRVEHSARLGHH